jgi:hypothetical protein
MNVDISPEMQTRAFLKTLDREANAFSFRVLPEGDKSSLKASNHVGGIAQLRPMLDKKNSQGCGVFVAVNEGGQRASEITRVRAVFADTDGAPLEPIKAALKPHIIVESSLGRWHVYWLVADGFPLDRFKPVQAAIAQKFGTDPSINDLPRIMRLPGFYHQKREPYLCRLIQLKPHLQRYSLDDLVNGLGLDLNGNVKSEPASRLNAENGPKADFAEVERALRYLNPFVPRDEWILRIFELAHEFGEGGRELAHRWSWGDLWTEERDGHA